MAKLGIQKYYLKNNRCYQKAQTRTPIGIQLHSIGCAQGTAKSVADYWNSPDVSACVTYICDCDVAGRVLKLVDEDVYTWADAGYGNRNLITFEICESDFMRYVGGASYEITNYEKFKADVLRGYDTAVALCADICKRYGWDPTAKLPSGLYLISSHDEGRIAGLSSAHVDPTHIWSRLNLSMDTFRKAVKAAISSGDTNVSDEKNVKYYRVRLTWEDASSQIGAFESLDNAKVACPFGYSVFDDEGKVAYMNITVPSGTLAIEFEKLTETAAASKILEIVHTTDKSGILPSVTAAQMILESGYVKTNLARSANNCFGMKANLSGNSWDSVWDGVSIVTIDTWENYNGKDVTISAAFRKYPDIETSIKDHAAYLLGAMNGKKKRYAGLLEAKNYREAVTIIKNGGYATDPNYISKVCSIIERFGLDKYDSAKEPAKEEKKKQVMYRAQVGMYSDLSNAKRRATFVKNKTGIDTSIEIVEGLPGDIYYQVICGSYKSKSSATKRVKVLKKEKIEAVVKEVTI